MSRYSYAAELGNYLPDYGNFNPVDPPNTSFANLEYLDEISFGGAIKADAHAKMVPPETVREQQYPDIYINGPEVGLPVQISTAKNAHWVIDASGRQILSTYRGRLKDHAGVKRAQRALSEHKLPAETFIPTTNMLDKSLKFSTKCVSNSTRGWKMVDDYETGGRKWKRMPGDYQYGTDDRRGELPKHTRAIYEGLLPDLNNPRSIERAQYADERNRAFDCHGMCR